MDFVKKAMPQASSLRQSLHKHLLRTERGRGYDRVHASSLTKEDKPFCPREFCLGRMYKKQGPMETLSVSLGVTFALGWSVQSMLTNWFIEMEQAVGNWKCKHCGFVYKFQKIPKQCGKLNCGHKHFEYEEIRVTAADTGHTSSLDLLLDRGGPHFGFVEIKTIAPDQFKTLTGPLAEHRVRTQLYLRSIDQAVEPEAQQIRADKASILYVSKGGFGCATEDPKLWDKRDAPYSPFKEYEIKRDDPATQPYWDKALAVANWEKTGVLPPRICPTAFDKRAKWCPLLKECFG